eukprot:442147-Amphidinium_carterae.1
MYLTIFKLVSESSNQIIDVVLLYAVHEHDCDACKSTIPTDQMHSWATCYTSKKRVRSPSVAYSVATCACFTFAPVVHAIIDGIRPSLGDYKQSSAAVLDLLPPRLRGGFHSRKEVVFTGIQSCTYKHFYLEFAEGCQ